MSTSSSALASAARRPLLAPWYRLVQEPDRLLLEHGGTVVTLEGRAAGLLLPKLLPLLDGTRTVEQVVAELGEAVEPSIRQALALLDEHGLLLGESSVLGACPSTEEARFTAAGAAGRPTPSTTAARLAAAAVGVAGRAPAADDVARLLAAGGPADVRRGGLELFHAEDLDLVVVAPERHETDLLSGANERALAVERPWLQLVPHDGRVVVVGPVYLPGRSACHECYRLRRAAGSDYEEDFELVEHTPGRSASPAALVAVSAGLAALLALRWLATRDASVPGRAYSIATRSLLELESHRVLRVPRCPACSPAEAALPSPWYRETVRDA